MPRWTIDSAQVLVRHENKGDVVVDVTLDIVTAQDGTLWVGLPLDDLGTAVEVEVYGDD